MSADLPLPDDLALTTDTGSPPQVTTDLITVNTPGGHRQASRLTARPPMLITTARANPAGSGVQRRRSGEVISNRGANQPRSPRDL